MRRYEFEHHPLNETGESKLAEIAGIFNAALAAICAVLDTAPEGVDVTPTHPREAAMLLTKMQEACAVAKRAVEIKPENQVDAELPGPALPPSPLRVIP